MSYNGTNKFPVPSEYSFQTIKTEKRNIHSVSIVCKQNKSEYHQIMDFDTLESKL